MASAAKSNDPAAAASASGFALLKRRSPLPTSFRAWHVLSCVLCLGFFLGIVSWKAFHVHDVAVSIQRDNVAQVTIQTIREPVARLLQQIETVGDHARSIATAYRMFSREQQHQNGFSVCEAPPPDTCSPMLERVLSNMGSYPEALTFVRYVYISAVTPTAMYHQPETTASVDPNSTSAPSSSSSSSSSSATKIHCNDEAALFPAFATGTSTTSSAPASTSTSSSSSAPANSTTSVGNVTTDPNVTTSASSSTMTSSSTSISSATGGKPGFWHECGCDLVFGCYYVDAAKQRRTFDISSGAQSTNAPVIAQDLDGLDYIEWVTNLTEDYKSRGQWNQPLEYREIYANSRSNLSSSSSSSPTSPPSSQVELLLQFSVPLSWDAVTGKCTAAASIDISSEFIASVLSTEEAANATFFFLDRRGPTLLGESSAVAENRIVRRKFNPFLASGGSSESYISTNVKQLMPMFRQWLGVGDGAKALPVNETRTHVGAYALAATPVGEHWLLLQAVGVSDISFDEYRFMRHGRLYLPVVVGASFIVVVILIEFVHGTFPSAEWKFDEEEKEEERRKELDKKRMLKRSKATKGGTHRAFELKMGNTTTAENTAGD